MVTTPREKLKEAVRRANKGGYSFTCPVAYQLLEIANNDIGLVNGYWHLDEKERADFEWPPNDIRDKFLKTVRTALAERVDHAYMLPPEQRFAAEMFRALCEYAAEANWNQKKEFEIVRRAYSGISILIKSRLRKAEERVSDLRLRRMELMAKNDMPYVPTAL